MKEHYKGWIFLRDTTKIGRCVGEMGRNLEAAPPRGILGKKGRE